MGTGTRGTRVFHPGGLIDIAALKGVTRLQKGCAITLADYQAALKAQGTSDATQGDVVLPDRLE